MPSRRELIALSPEEIQEFLEAQKTLIIVSNGRDGYPHPMPMWYYTDPDGCLYCTTFKKAQKVFNWQRDAKASLLVESGEEYAELKSVLIYATAEIIDDIDEVCEALVNIGSKGRTLSADEHQAMKGGMTKTAEKRMLLRFTPQRYVSWDHAKLGGKY